MKNWWETTIVIAFIICFIIAGIILWNNIDLIYKLPTIVICTLLFVILLALVLLSLPLTSLVTIFPMLKKKDKDEK